MGHGVSLVHSRFKVEIQATKLLQVAESSCAVKKSEEEKKQLGAFCPQLLQEVKIWHKTTDPGFLLNSMFKISSLRRSTSISMN